MPANNVPLFGARRLSQDLQTRVRELEAEVSAAHAREQEAHAQFAVKEAAYRNEAQAAERAVAAARERVAAVEASATSAVLEARQRADFAESKLRETNEFAQRYEITDAVKMHNAIRVAQQELEHLRQKSAQLAAQIDQRVAEARVHVETEMTAHRESVLRAVETERASLDTRAKSLRTSVKDLLTKEEAIGVRIADAEAGVEALRLSLGDLLRHISTVTQTSPDAALYADYGLYEFEHPAANSVELKEMLGQTRAQMRDLVKRKQACTTAASFLFGNDAKAGEKFIQQMSTMMLRAYNAEAENIMKNIKKGGLDANVKRLVKAREDVGKLGAMIEMTITDEYHRLRVHELELAIRHQNTLEVERERQKAKNAATREQRAAEKEAAAEQERLEKEKAQKLLTLENLRRQAEEAAAARTAGDEPSGPVDDVQLAASIAEIETSIAEVDAAIEGVEERRSNTRAGFVYVISNVGSFGEGIVKIGMTRRKDPQDRVDELGSASVPFRFDVHTLYYSEDAVALETALHRRFDARRVNKVNLHREHFRVTPQEVLDAMKDLNAHVVEFNTNIEAAEYRESVAIEAAM